jgi:hypothetical protein
LGSTGAEEEALNTFSGQGSAANVKHVLIVGLGFFFVAVIMTLVTLSLNFSDVAFEMALS